MTSQSPSLRGLLRALVPSLTLLASMCLPVSADELPTWKQIEQVTTATLVDKNHPAGTLLSQSRAQEALAALARLGWNVPGQKQLLDRILPDSDFLVRALSTPQGEQFARQIARLPEGYDRVDHLRKLPRGEQTLHDLIQGPDGYKMIEYMTTSAGGKNMGTMLSQDPNGAGFNRPTSRVYTVDDFLAQLHVRYRYQTEQAQSSR